MDEDIRPADVAISVIIPTYNRATTLPRAIDSVLAQTHRRFTLVIVDDGSSDDTAAVVAQYVDPRVRYVRQDNAGVCAARNRGIAESCEPYVTFLDSDDHARPHWLEVFAEAFARGAALVATGCALHEADGTVHEEVPAPQSAAFGGVAAVYLPGSFALARWALVAAGQFSVGLRYSENTDLGLRLGTLAVEGRLQVTALDAIGVDMIRRPPGLDPVERYESAMFLLQARSRELMRSPNDYATYWAIAGSSARRLRLRREALRCHLNELRWRRSLVGVGRLVRAVVGR